MSTLTTFNKTTDPDQHKYFPIRKLDSLLRRLEKLGPDENGRVFKIQKLETDQQDEAINIVYEIPDDHRPSHREANTEYYASSAYAHQEDGGVITIGAKQDEGYFISLPYYREPDGPFMRTVDLPADEGGIPRSAIEASNVLHTVDPEEAFAIIFDRLKEWTNTLYGRIRLEEFKEIERQFASEDLVKGIEEGLVACF